MSVLIHLSAFALRHVVDGACSKLGLQMLGDKAGDVLSDKVVDFLTGQFIDHSQRLTEALEQSNKRAWKAVEIALAGDSFWERCKVFVARAEDKAFGLQVRAFLDATPLPVLAGKTKFRQAVLDELRSAHKAGLLTGGALEPRELAKRAGAFARFSDPESLIKAEHQAHLEMADEVRRSGYANLAWFLEQRPAQGHPVHVAGVRYFFRRAAVEEDQQLFQGLAFARLEAIKDGQDGAFAALSDALTRQGDRLEELLGDVKVIVVETHTAVLDLQTQMRGQGEQIAQIGEAILKLLEQRELHKRELRPADSLSVRNETERQLVKQTTGRYRALPEEDRRRVPALLHAVGKLEVVAGDFEQARQDFQGVAALTADAPSRAEAHYNAYRAALERAGETRAREDWDKALAELIQAVKADGRRFLPFPASKYQPRRILGAGGFGVVFLCKHREMNDLVVVKTLVHEELDRDADQSFAEARVLRQLDHPAIIRTLDAGYMDREAKSRPYLVMDYFDGLSLEEYVRVNGPLSPEDLVLVARQAAEGLRAAHGKGVLHRDVKPANLLIRKEENGWKVKVIDFGLALVKKGSAPGSASTSRQSKSLMGASVAGTLHYAAPEQMGQMPGVAVGPYSDVYGFGKTCAYALFKTTQTRTRHFAGLPRPLTELLEACMEEQPEMRPADFTRVLERLMQAENELFPELEVVKPGPELEVIEPISRLEAIPLSAAPAPVPPAKDPWYYMHRGQRIGPVTQDDLRGRIAAGQLARGDVVWKNGMANWVPAEHVPDLTPARRPAPPPIPGVQRTMKMEALPTVERADMAYVRFFMPAPGFKGLFDPSYRTTLKLYLDGEFNAEAPYKAGFDRRWEVQPGDHVLEIVKWLDGEKNRKRFEVRLDRPGHYVIRFNYVWRVIPGFTRKNDHMQDSTIDVRERPRYGRAAGLVPAVWMA